MFWIALGGAVGAIGRFLLGKVLSRRAKSTVPLATVIINLLGSLGLGIVVAIYTVQDILAPLNTPSYLILVVGFFGAFTTFSTFSVEMLQLWHRRAFWSVVLYMLLSIGGSIAFFLLGSMVTAILL